MFDVITPAAISRVCAAADAPDWLIAPNGQLSAAALTLPHREWEPPTPEFEHSRGAWRSFDRFSVFRCSFPID
jgi:hypothetical protein